MSDDEHNRPLPVSDSDFNLMLCNSVWGNNEVSPDLRSALAEFFENVDDSGQVVYDQRSMWGLMSFFTRDLRLGNLSVWDGELAACRYHLDLCQDLLVAEMPAPFLISLSRVASVVETSQSKGGFLRRLMNTLRTESINQTLEPPKKGFLGGYKKDNGGGY